MTRTVARHEVSCHQCGASFDASVAHWCSCVGSDHSLVCPSCGSCFCRAPRAYQQAFWAAAPPGLRERGQRMRASFAPPANPEPQDVRRPLVLLVDDEAVIQKVAYRVIAGLGYGVVLARDGSEGLDLARRYRPDLVLTDALMPKLDGRELSLRVKSDPGLEGVRTVVMTALYKNVKYEAEAYRIFKVDGYLKKPLDAAELEAVLKKLLE